MCVRVRLWELCECWGRVCLSSALSLECATTWWILSWSLLHGRAVALPVFSQFYLARARRQLHQSGTPYDPLHRYVESGNASFFSHLAALASDSESESEEVEPLPAEGTASTNFLGCAQNECRLRACWHYDLARVALPADGAPLKTRPLQPLSHLKLVTARDSMSDDMYHNSNIHLSRTHAQTSQTTTGCRRWWEGLFCEVDAAPLAPRHHQPLRGQLGLRRAGP